MKFLVFLIILIGAFWFFFSPKPVVVNNDDFDYDEYSQTDRKSISDIDVRELKNEVDSNLDKVENKISSIKAKTKEFASPVLENEKVKSFIEEFKIRWGNFRVWVFNLPGIKQYRESIYSDENWKNEMGSLDFAEYVRQNKNADSKMLEEERNKMKKI